MRLGKLVRRLRRSDDGVAAIELSLVGAMFCFGVLNVAEISRYAYCMMQSTTATQMGVAAALAACDEAHLPATQNCSGLNSAVTTSIQGTSLGSQITLSDVTEGYYCVNGSGVLTSVSGPTSPPTDCSGAGNAAGKPALYLKISTAFTYSPLFPGATVVTGLPNQFVRSAWTRMK